MACVALPAAHDRVAIDRIELQNPRTAPADFRRDQRRAGPAKHIEHDVAAHRTVLHGVRDQRHRLYCRVHRQLLRALSAHAGDARIIPHVGAMPSGLSKAEIVDVRPLPRLEYEDQLVFGAVERAHAGVGLVPDAEVLELAEDSRARFLHFAHVPPVHAHIGDGAIPADPGGVAERLGQELREL